MVGRRGMERLGCGWAGAGAGERALWAALTAASLAAAGCLLALQAREHAGRVTIATLASPHFPAWNVRFPAVTVCDVNRVHLARARSFVGSAALPAHVSRQQLLDDLGWLAALTAPPPWGLAAGSAPAGLRRLHRLQAVLDANGMDVAELMKRLAPSCAGLLARCSWKGTLRSCDDIFALRRTHEGYCCSFNDLVKNDASLVRRAPRRIASAGRQTGLSVLVAIDPSQYHSAVLASYGVKVLVHEPYDYPAMNAVEKLVPAGAEVFFSLRPWVTAATRSVRSVAPARRGWRGCAFPNEWSRPLALVKRYSYDNCLVECRRNATAALCGRAPFFYPGDGVWPMCSLLDVPCIGRHRQMLQTMYPTTDANFSYPETDNFRYPCDCVPDYYSIEDSSSQLAMVTNSRVLFSGNLEARNQNVFHIFYGNFMATRYRRTIFKSWHVLLGTIYYPSFGGILSLCIGFSFISSVEILYFFTRLAYISVHKALCNFSTLKRTSNLQQNHPQASQELMRRANILQVQSYINEQK